MWILVTTALLLCLAVPAPGDGTVLTKTFEAPAFDVEKAYRVYLPDGYVTGGAVLRYSVIPTRLRQRLRRGESRGRGC